MRSPRQSGSAVLIPQSCSKATVTAGVPCPLVPSDAPLAPPEPLPSPARVLSESCPSPQAVRVLSESCPSPRGCARSVVSRFGEWRSGGFLFTPRAVAPGRLHQPRLSRASRGSFRPRRPTGAQTGPKRGPKGAQPGPSPRVVTWACRRDGWVAVGEQEGRARGRPLGAALPRALRFRAPRGPG